MMQQCSRVIRGLPLYNMHANTKDRPQVGDDSTESRGVQVRSYVSWGEPNGLLVLRGRRSPGKERLDGN